MEDMANMAAWFAHPVYGRYWQHYQQAMTWQQRHRRAYRKALEAAYGPSDQPYQPYQPYQSDHKYQPSHPYQRPPGGRGRTEERLSARGPVGEEEEVGQVSEEEEEEAGQVLEEEEEEEEEEGGQVLEKEEEEEGEMDSESGGSSDSEIECDVSNMEITDELRQYFAQTERHRDELKRQQQLEAEQEEGWVPADRDMRAACRLSARPPWERPGERRTAEMRRLYGDAAATIQGMETALQLAFDRHCDRKQPKYWPVIPLRL